MHGENASCKINTDKANLRYYSWASFRFLFSCVYGRIKVTAGLSLPNATKVPWQHSISVYEAIGNNGCKLPVAEGVLGLWSDVA